jgi:hypothetical protein
VARGVAREDPAQVMWHSEERKAGYLDLGVLMLAANDGGEGACDRGVRVWWQGGNGGGWRDGTPWGKGISENVIWYVVRRCAERMRLDRVAPHDLRRTCAKLCHVNGGELEQIQFLLGHVSVLTTERYLGCKQNLEEPVNDRFGSLFASTRVDLR